MIRLRTLPQLRTPPISSPEETHGRSVHRGAFRKDLVELRGIEPLTLSMPLRCSTN